MPFTTLECSGIATQKLSAVQLCRVAPLIHHRINVLRLIGSKERYDSNRSACESFVLQDRFNLICDRLRFTIVSIVMVPTPPST